MKALNDLLMADLKVAMKNKDTVTKGVLTLLRAGLTAKEKEKKDALTKEEEVEVLMRELKQTKDTIAEAKKAGREDVVEAQEKRIDVIQIYMPAMMTEDEIVAFLTQKGAKKGMNIGQLMGMLMSEKKGKVEGGFAQEVIKKHFA